MDKEYVSNLAEEHGNLSYNVVEIKRLLEGNQKIMKLLINNTKQCLDAPDLTEDEIDGKAGQHIFPYAFDPVIEDGSDSFICLSYGRVGRGEDNHLSVNSAFSIKIYCYKDIQTIDSGIRPLIIFNEINKTINGKHISGVGEVMFDVAYEISANRNFYGYEMFYLIYDIDSPRVR